MKKFLVAFVLATILALVAIPVLAVVPDSGSLENPNNVYLVGKGSDWSPIWDGAWGKLNYKLSEDKIVGVFNGHGLIPGTEYALIEYVGWPTVVVLGTATVNDEGDIHIAVNTTLTPSQELTEQYKIWLVPTSDITEGSLNKWNPSAVLFEQKFIP